MHILYLARSKCRISAESRVILWGFSQFSRSFWSSASCKCCYIDRRLFVLIFSSAKFISFRVWCIFFQINRHAAAEKNARFFRVGHMYECSIFLPNFSAHLLNFTISHVTSTQNRKLAVKITRSLHSLFSSEFWRLAAQDEARSVPTKAISATYWWR